MLTSSSKGVWMCQTDCACAQVRPLQLLSGQAAAFRGLSIDFPALTVFQKHNAQIQSRRREAKWWLHWSMNRTLLTAWCLAQEVAGRAPGGWEHSQVGIRVPVSWL